MKRLIILGTGAFAEEVADLVADAEEYRVVGFGENLSREKVPGPLLGLPVHWVDELGARAADCEAVCAIGTTRRRLFTARVEELGLPFARVVHPSARLSRTARIGPGTILSVGVVVAAQTRLGRHVIVNRGSLIGHHTRIGDHTTVSPGANIGGRVAIGEGTYVGMGAIVLNDLRIGSGAIVGAGAVVTRDVPDRVQVMGVPARVTREGVDGR